MNASERSTIEQAIRDAAATVINTAVNRRDHPSFGNTKGSIRAELARMDGMIGLYMLLDGQAAHTSVPGLALFTESATTDRVNAAYQVGREL